MTIEGVETGEGSKRRHSQCEGTRRKLIASASRLVQEFGFAGVGIEQIARHAGVSKSTFYNHFECRDDLLGEVVIGDCDGDALRAELRKQAGDDPVDQLLAYFDYSWLSREQAGRAFLPAVSAINAYRHENDPIRSAAIDRLEQTRVVLRELVAEALGEESEEAFEGYWMVVAAHAMGMPWGGRAAAKRAAASVLGAPDRVSTGRY